ncbi:MAG: hypothetical protein OXE77_01540 [Flavobacteriaceae bacterium]|nr:hypothetical protein [Flavobacteriaceae bacterium]MCY4267259.1 hypothetical protein [Flavobacteriaceae bacterium]
MILVVSHKDDYTTDYIINKLNNQNHSYKRLNTEDIGSEHHVLVRYNKTKNISIDGINEFNSVWFRRTAISRNSLLTNSKEKFHERDFRLFLKSLWRDLKVKKWLSYPDFIGKAENKLLQLELANELGFLIPDTIITTNQSELKKFYTSYKKGVVIKPLFGGRYFDETSKKVIFTNRFDISQLEQNNHSIFPIIFQEEIKKIYEIRVTVVDNQVFSAKIKSQQNKNPKMDWRNQSNEIESYQLPLLYEKKCIELTKSLKLNFGAIDLIKTENGYVFLEINPNGQWVWIESNTGLNISDAIIHFLSQ